MIIATLWTLYCNSSANGVRTPAIKTFYSSCLDGETIRCTATLLKTEGTDTLECIIG